MESVFVPINVQLNKHHLEPKILLIVHMPECAGQQFQTPASLPIARSPAREDQCMMAMRKQDK